MLLFRSIIILNLRQSSPSQRLKSHKKKTKRERKEKPQNRQSVLTRLRILSKRNLSPRSKSSLSNMKNLNNLQTNNLRSLRSNHNPARILLARTRRNAIARKKRSQKDNLRPSLRKMLHQQNTIRRSRIEKRDMRLLQLT